MCFYKIKQSCLIAINKGKKGCGKIDLNSKFNQERNLNQERKFDINLEFLIQLKI